MALLSWSSFPVFVLALFVIIEALPFWRRGLRASRWWIASAWFCRPLAVWAVFNIFIRIFAELGLNNRKTFPFYVNLWNDQETWMATFQRLTHNPEFWRWSLVVLLLGGLFLLLCRRITSAAMTPVKVAAILAGLVALNFAMPLAYDCLPEGMIDPTANQGSFLNVWFDSGSTMLYCMPHIKSADNYLRNFERIQPQLYTSIHGVSHPPGASLALYWVGKPFGATRRIGDDRLRYALGMTLFSTLSVLAMYLLGRSLFASNEIGLMSAALWAVKPATLAYNTFAPDTVYAVFDILCLMFSWRVVMAEKRPWFGMIVLGLLFYILSMLNFNWPVFVAVFGVFLLLYAYRKAWRPSEWLWRGAIPVLFGGGLLLWTCCSYHLNYTNIFRYALAYVYECYHFNSLYKWTIALLGGPMDLCILSGSFCAYIFWRHFHIELRQPILTPVMLFLLVICAFYLAPTLCSNVLKMESSRVWAWVTAVPLVMVANSLRNSEHPRFYFLMAAALSMIQYYGMRLFLSALG